MFNLPNWVQHCKWQLVNFHKKRTKFSYKPAYMRAFQPGVAAGANVSKNNITHNKPGYIISSQITQPNRAHTFLETKLKKPKDVRFIYFYNIAMCKVPVA